MDRIPLSPPTILPLPENIQRPLWSVMIPAYNCSIFLEKTLESVLLQDPGSDVMQIEVIDDCSDDADVKELVSKIGGGRVKYYRQPENVGSLRNFETCINRAHGQYVHLLHGDDLVKKGFYKSMTALLEKFPEVGAAFCAYDMIREDNSLIGHSKKDCDAPCILDNWLYKIAVESRLQYVCMVVKRQVYEKVGSFYLTTYGEDWEMWTRIAKSFPVAYTPETLAEYRVHSNSITGNSYLTGANVRDISKIIEKITAHVPVEAQRLINKKARKYYAYDALKKIYSLWYRSRNKNGVVIQIREILKLYKDVNLVLKSALVRLFMIIPSQWLPGIRYVAKRTISYVPVAKTNRESLDPIHIALAFDKNFIEPLYALLTSIFINNENVIFTFHAIVIGLNNDELNNIKSFVLHHNSKIIFYDVDENLVSGFVLPDNTHFSLSTYYRIFFPAVVPQGIKKLIYLDTDIIVIGDLSKLYSIYFSGPVAAAVDPKGFKRPELGIYEEGQYFNSGVLLINIEEWKKQEITSKTVEFLRKFPERIIWVDQDALNAVLINNWEKLPVKYNVTFYDIPEFLPRKKFRTFLKDKIVIHYTTQSKPWMADCTNRLRYLYAHYLKKSPYYTANKKIERIQLTTSLKMLKRSIKDFLIDYTQFYHPKRKETK